MTVFNNGYIGAWNIYESSEHLLEVGFLPSLMMFLDFDPEHNRHDRDEHISVEADSAAPSWAHSEFLKVTNTLIIITSTVPVAPLTNQLQYYSYSKPKSIAILLVK